MGRVMFSLFAVGLGLLFVGLLTASTAIGTGLVLAGLTTLALTAAAAMIRAQRVHGATWDVNPGAAHREAEAERKAQERAAKSTVKR
jgi:hypothetical protein